LKRNHNRSPPGLCQQGPAAFLFSFEKWPRIVKQTIKPQVDKSHGQASRILNFEF
jgi:hypothetical protein